MENSEEKLSQYKRMTTEPVGRLLASLSVPTVITMLVTNIYNIVDTAFVGKLGTSQSGATGVVFSFMSVLQAVAFMCGQGSGSIMARKLGQKDLKEATMYSSTGFFLSLFFGTLIGTIGIVFAEPIVYLCGSTRTIAPYAKTYIMCICASAPFFTSSLTLNNLLRYEGRAKLGTIGMMVGAVLNIGLDAFLMFVCGMGILGAGIATAASQMLSFVILLSMFLRGKTQTKISYKFFAKDFKVIFLILATGLPSLVRQGFLSFSTLLLNRYSREYGDAAVAAMSCVSRISNFTMAFAVGIGQGFQPISSFNFGAGRKDRVRKAFWTGVAGEEVVLLLLGIPMYLFAPFFISLLRDANDVIEIGTRALKLMAVTQLFIPLTMMVEMGLQSIGKKALASFASSLRSGILLIPSLIILAGWRGLAGIQEAQPASIILTFIVGLFICKIYLKQLE